MVERRGGRLVGGGLTLVAVLALCAGAAAAAAHAARATRAADCPAGSGHALRIEAPPQLAFGRRWSFAVVRHASSGLKFSTVTLTMRLRGSAAPFATEHIAVREFGVAQLVNRAITLHR